MATSGIRHFSEPKNKIADEPRISLLKRSSEYVKTNLAAAEEIASFNFAFAADAMEKNSAGARVEIVEKSLEFSRSIKGASVFLSQNLVKSAMAAGNFITEKIGKFADRDKNKLASVSQTNLFAENVANGQVEKKPEIFCTADWFLKEYAGSAALMSYLEYGKNIVEYNMEKRWPIASISKLMTVVVAEEKIGFNSKIKMSAEAIATYGTSGEFSEDEIFSSRDLIKAALVVSSNDAAAALAESYGKADFVNEMQKKAKELGMYQTTYLEPTGLSYVNQSTISDLEKLARYIYKTHPDLLEISRQKSVSITDLKSGKARKIFNVDRFAGEPNFLGGKTGFIDEAGRNLLAFFNEDGQAVLTIVLGTDDSFVATEKLVSILKSCRTDNL